MLDSTSKVRAALTNRAVVGLLGLQAVATAGVMIGQAYGWEQISYALGIVPELAIIFYAALENLLGIPLLTVSDFLPIGALMLLVAYYLIAVVVATPSRAVYKFIQRRAAH